MRFRYQVLCTISIVNGKVARILNIVRLLYYRQGITRVFDFHAIKHDWEKAYTNVSF
jgi:hypothetical protein